MSYCLFCVYAVQSIHSSMCLAYVCMYDNAIVIYWWYKHHRKSSYFLRMQVFYILMAAKSDNIYIARHSNMQYLLVNSIKKHTHTHPVIRLCNGNGLVQPKRNRMHYKLVIWVYCIRINVSKWNEMIVLRLQNADQCILFPKIWFAARMLWPLLLCFCYCCCCLAFRCSGFPNTWYKI